MEEYKDTPALDAGLLAAAQAVEHYEITRYGTLRRWAEMMGMPEAAKLLDETLQEESQTDEELTMLADRSVNEEAMQAEGMREERQKNGKGERQKSASRKK
jgi:ferritin-like metal-binding protein YciE